MLAKPADQLIEFTIYCNMLFVHMRDQKLKANPGLTILYQLLRKEGFILMCPELFSSCD